MANNANKSFKWSRNTTLLLISLIGKNYNQLQSGVKKFTFQKVACEINEQFGTSLAYDQVESKWKGLRRTYKKVQESKTQLSWEYYDAVDKILKDDMEINNPLVTATSDEPFVTGCETEFDFVEYVVEPASSSTQQNRKRRRSSDEDRNERRESMDEEPVAREIRNPRNTYDNRKGRGAHSRRRSSDDERSFLEIRKRRSSDDSRSGYESRRVPQGRRNTHDGAEETRERRHQEKMKLARRFLAIFERMVEKM